MKIRIKNNRFLPLPLLAFLVLYIMYSLADFSTSNQTGFRFFDRSDTHTYTLLITIFLFFYLAFHLRKIKLSRVLIGLLCIAAWTVLVNCLMGVSRWTVLVQTNMSVVWIFSYLFFESVRSSENTERSKIDTFSLLLLIFFLGVMVYYFFDMMRRIGRFPVLTMAYYVLAIVPWVFPRFSKNKNLFFVVIVSMALLSMKRGAIVAVLFMVLTDRFIDMRQSRCTRRRFIADAIFVVCIIAALLIVENKTGGSLSKRFAVEELASGSGRREQLLSVIEELRTREIGQLLIGVGCERCVNIYGTGIHNEWLAFLYNYGVIGLLLYAYLFFAMTKVCVEVPKMVPRFTSSAYMMLVLYFVLSMVSAAYGAYWGMWLFGLWGYLSAEIRANKERGGVNEYLR